MDAGANQCFFNPPHVFDDADLFRKTSQVEYGISDELPRTVKGYVAAAVDLKNLDALAGEKLTWRYDVRFAGIAAQRDYGEMLQQKENIVDAVLLAQLHEVLLQAQGGAIVDGSEMDYRDQNLFTTEAQSH